MTHGFSSHSRGIRSDRWIRMGSMIKHLRTARATTLAVVPAAVFILASGLVHLREWLVTYRKVPTQVPGSAVVRVGFPINTAVSVVLAILLIVAALRASRWLTLLVAGVAAFEASSLVTLILSRTSSVLGWSEMGWTSGAAQTRALEIAALISLAVFVALGRLQLAHDAEGAMARVPVRSGTR